MNEPGFTHTPGPWSAGGFSSIVGVPVMAQPDPTKNTFNVCGVAAPVSREENIANARLIAAAPDMLDVIEHLVNGTADIDTIYEDARQVVAKARGHHD